MAAQYDAVAAEYDGTRSASRSTLGALQGALGRAEGRSLLDIGGGTGNYALVLREAGFRVTVADVSIAMLRRATDKLAAGVAVMGDALRLPFRDGAFDCALSVNVSHHVASWQRHIAEARRVVGDGTFALQLNTRENLEAHWLFHYFPEATAPTLAYHPAAEEVVTAIRAAGFLRVDSQGYIFEDQADGTFEALKHAPETYLDPLYRRNTTFFRRLASEVERRGLERLRADHASGRLADVIARYEPRLQAVGDSTVFVGAG